jgi:hypothetical protein
MKIKIKISEKQLGALVFSFNELPKTPAKERTAKVAKSVLDKVALKLRKKHLEVQSKLDLFNPAKKFPLEFELVEAHFLEQFITVMGNYPMCEYDKNVLLQIASNLNQQLA